MISKLVDDDRFKWLSDELTELCGRGAIDEVIRRKILENYSPESIRTETMALARFQPSVPVRFEEASSLAKAGKQNYFLLVLILLGALLIGSGVVLLFAHNWDSLSKFQRIMIAFIPVSIGAVVGVYTIVKDKDARWQELAAFFTATGFVVLTALISQIYHIGGTFIQFWQLTMAVSLPLVYIFRSQLLAAVYCLGIFVFYRYSSGLHHQGWYYLAGIMPFILYYLFFVKQQGLRTVWMRYVSFLPMLLLILTFKSYDYLHINLFATASMLYAVGLLYKDKEELGWKNPWLVVGWILLTVLSMYYSYGWHLWKDPFYWDENSSLSLVFWMSLFVAYIYVSGRRLTLLRLVVIMSPLLPLLWVGIAIDSYVMTWISSLYFALVSVASLASGVKNKGLFEVNVGMLQLILLIMIKFFAADISILTRAVVFIVIGAAFIATNIYLSRRFKKAKSPIVAEVGEWQC